MLYPTELRARASIVAAAPVRLHADRDVRQRLAGLHWAAIAALLKKYSDRPISLADACLIQCAGIHQEVRIATFDSDFAVYKWAPNRKFELV